MIPVPTREASPMQKAWKRRCHPARRPAMKTPSATDVRSGGTRPSVSDTEVQAGCQQNVDEEPSPKEGTHWIDQILKLFHKGLPPILCRSDVVLVGCRLCPSAFWLSSTTLRFLSVDEYLGATSRAGFEDPANN